MECCHRRRQYFSGRSEITVQAFGRFEEQERTWGQRASNRGGVAGYGFLLFHSDWMPDCMSIKRPQAN
jgi:hypothetical protein